MTRHAPHFGQLLLHGHARRCPGNPWRALNVALSADPGEGEPVPLELTQPGPVYALRWHHDGQSQQWPIEAADDNAARNEVARWVRKVQVLMDEGHPSVASLSGRHLAVVLRITPCDGPIAVHTFEFTNGG